LTPGYATTLIQLETARRSTTQGLSTFRRGDNVEVACLGLGAASTALTLVTGGAAAPLAAALVGGVTGGAAGNFGHEVCKALDQRVVGALFERRSGIAENHVVTQALRLAQLKALGVVLEQFDIARASDRDAARREEGQRFSTELAKFIVEQQADAEALAFTGQDGVTPREEEFKGGRV
jgi:hypothetical protein